jgi:hypothetical protein
MAARLPIGGRARRRGGPQWCQRSPFCSSMVSIAPCGAVESGSEERKASALGFSGSKSPVLFELKSRATVGSR